MHMFVNIQQVKACCYLKRCHPFQSKDPLCLSQHQESESWLHQNFLIRGEGEDTNWLVLDDKQTCAYG